MTPEREKEIRDLISLDRWKTTPLNSVGYMLWDLVAEIDRLRTLPYPAKVGFRSKCLACNELRDRIEKLREALIEIEHVDNIYTEGYDCGEVAQKAIDVDDEAAKC